MDFEETVRFLEGSALFAALGDGSYPPAFNSEQFRSRSHRPLASSGKGHLQYNRHQSDQRRDDHPLDQYAAIQSMKTGIVDLAGLATTPVFSFPFFRRYPLFLCPGDCPTYSVFCICRRLSCAVPFIRSCTFLTGTFAKTRIIATTTLIVAATHLHLKSLVFPLHIVVPNIFLVLAL